MYGDAKIIQNLRFLLLYTYFYAAPNDTVNIGELCMTGTLQWLRVDLLLPHPVWNLDSAMCAKYRVICYTYNFLRTFKQIEVYQATSKVASLHGWLLGYSCIFWILVIFGSRAVLIGSSFMGFCSFIYSTYNIASITEKDL